MCVYLPYFYGGRLVVVAVTLPPGQTVLWLVGLLCQHKGILPLPKGILREFYRCPPQVPLCEQTVNNVKIDEVHRLAQRVVSFEIYPADVIRVTCIACLRSSDVKSMLENMEDYGGGA